MRSLNPRVGGFLGIEEKFYDTSLVGSAITAATDCSGGEKDPASVNCISAPAQGDGESNRDGKDISITRVHVAGRVHCPAQADQTGLDVTNVVFIALVLDTQTNGAQLNSEDVFTNPAADASLNAHPLRDLQYSRRFKVLKTKLLNMDPPQSSYDGTNIEVAGVSRNFRFDIPKCNIPVNFTGTTAGVSNVTNNSLHLIAFSTLTTMTPGLNYNARIRFVG